MKRILAAAITVGALTLAGPAGAREVHHCRPLKGYDTKGLRVTHIGCANARQTILYGVRRGNVRVYTYKGRRWHTRKIGNYPPSGYKQVWTGGDHKRIWLTWLGGNDG